MIHTPRAGLRFALCCILHQLEMRQAFVGRLYPLIDKDLLVRLEE